MSKYLARSLGCAGGILLSVAGAPAFAEDAKAPFGAPMTTEGGWTFDPIMDARLRYEMVDQDNVLDNADAVTLRVRAGIEARTPEGISLLGEVEGTAALGNNYDAFPFPIVDDQNRAAYSVVADPENVEINRLQVGFENEVGGFTLGRQRIVLGDSRWVGNVGWRQNEQTFDALRIKYKDLGPASLDLIYSKSQRTIFGGEAQSRTAYDGDLYLGNLGLALGPVNVTGFAYLIDYDVNEPVALTDTQTYGAVATASIPLGEDFKLNLKGSYAVQKDYADNPGDFSVDYIAAEAGVNAFGFALTGGYEQLGADSAGNRVQTPLATLHKFNGWADMFLSTPVAGLTDYYGTIGKKFPGVTMLPGLNASLTYHKFESDEGSVDYGEEWDAVIGFKLMGAGVLAKYANYDADLFGVDTEKLWLQVEYKF